MKKISIASVAMLLISCTQGQRDLITMDLVYQYPLMSENSYDKLMKQLSAARRLSLKEGQLVYYDGQNYYVYPQRARLFSIRTPHTDKEIRAHSIKLTKQEVEDMMQGKHGAAE